MSTTENRETKKCKAEGCKRAYRAKGYCNIHFRKWRRGEMPVKTRYKICCEEACRKPLFQFGMCEEHYGAWVASKKGTPQTTGTTEIAPAPAALPAEAVPPPEQNQK